MQRVHVLLVDASCRERHRALEALAVKRVVLFGNRAEPWPHHLAQKVLILPVLRNVARLPAALCSRVAVEISEVL